MGSQFEHAKPVQCFPYSFDLLCELLSEASGTPIESTRAKLHLTYFKEYLGHFQDRGCLTIVVEWQYTDRDFLEDYASYYVRCFNQKYKSICVRLHFFQGALDETFLAGQLSTARSEIEIRLNQRYLGFLVVKPIPHKFVGRTCLRTYESSGRRFFPALCRCEAHLLGLRLHVESLAFQEQDTVAAACATSALWSVLHATASLFRHKIYTPVEITKIATEKFPTLARSFPNAGLTSTQIAAAIQDVGLEPEVLPMREKAQLQSTAYAYLRAGIPCLLIAELFDLTHPENPIPFDNKLEATHAVAVTGYSMGKSESELFQGTPTLRSSRIDKLYVHDDGVGPFSRLEFDGPCFKVDLGQSKPPRNVGFTMRSSWKGKKGTVGAVCFAPVKLIVPVYHKIRVPYALILRIVRDMDKSLRKDIPSYTEPNELQWDVFLTSATDFKKELRDAPDARNEIKWAGLERPLPRFLWRATCFICGTRWVDILYDATDIAQSTSLEVATIWYDQTEPT